MAVNVAAVTKGLAQEEWLALRKQGIGGSDASAVAGVNRYKTPLTVWAEKTGLYEPERAGEPAYWGNQLEDVVAREFTIRTGLRVKRSHKMYKHPKYPYMLGNVDRLIIDKDRGKGILECKTASAFKASEWQEGRVPDEYAIQLQHYLAVLHMDYGYFAVLIGGNQFKHQLVERNPVIIDALIEIEHKFWDEHVRTGIPPSVGDSEADTELLQALYPTSKACAMELTSDQHHLITELRTMQEEEKKIQSRMTWLKNQVKGTLQENEVANFNGLPVATWKTTESMRVDTKRLKAEQPEIYRKYTVSTSSRRFVMK